MILSFGKSDRLFRFALSSTRLHVVLFYLSFYVKWGDIIA